MSILSICILINFICTVICYECANNCGIEDSKKLCLWCGRFNVAITAINIIRMIVEIFN